MRRLYDVLTVKEAAELKGTSVEAARKWCQRNLQASDKVGGVWLIKKKDLDRWNVQRKRRGDDQQENEQ